MRDLDKRLLRKFGAKLMSVLWWTQVCHREPGWLRLDLVSDYYDDTKRSLSFSLSLFDFIKPFPSIINSWSLNEPYTEVIVCNWQFFFSISSCEIFCWKTKQTACWRTALGKHHCILQLKQEWSATLKPSQSPPLPRFLKRIQMTEHHCISLHLMGMGEWYEMYS